MNIKHENVPGQVQEVTFEINKEDYAASLEAALRKQRRSVQIPGFRPGNAPMGIVKKMYEKSLLVQEIDRLVNESMDKFMKDNNVKYIFEPLPVEGKTKADFDSADNFEFVYEYALAPEVNIDYAKLPEVIDFKMIPSDEECKKYIDNLRKRHGNYSEPETIEDDDNVSVKYGEDKVSYIALEQLTPDARKGFAGKKIGDTVTLSLRQAFNNNYALAHFLRIDAKDLEEGNDYTYELTISHIGRIELAVINEEFFKKAFPDGTVTTEQQLKDKVISVFQQQYAQEIDRKFMNDAVEMLVNNVAIELPDDFIKRYVRLVQKDMTEEKLNEQYDDIRKSFKWQIIEEKLVAGEDVRVNAEEVKDYFRQYFINNYFANFNAEDVAPRIEALVKQAMENKENLKNVYDQLYDAKLVKVLRSKLNLKTKEGNIDMFVDMLVGRDKKAESKEEEAAPKKSASRKSAAKSEEQSEENSKETVEKPKKTAAKKTKKTTEQE